MGCVLCNITSCEEFLQGGNPPIKNPFYSKTNGEREQFLEELAHDIASQHPELVRKINGYFLLQFGHVSKLEEKVVQVIMLPGGYVEALQRLERAPVSAWSGDELDALEVAKGVLKEKASIR